MRFSKSGFFHEFSMKGIERATTTAMSFFLAAGLIFERAKIPAHGFWSILVLPFLLFLTHYTRTGRGGWVRHPHLGFG